MTFSTNYYRTRQDSPYEPVLSELKILNAHGDYTLTPGYDKKKGENYPEKPMEATSFSSLLKYSLSDIFAETTVFSTDAYYQKAHNIFFYSNSFEYDRQSVINSDKQGVRPNLIANLTLNSNSLSLILV